MSGTVYFEKTGFKMLSKKSALIFIVFLSILLKTVSCETDIERIKSFSEDALMPSQRMVNAEIVYTDSARLQLRLKAPEINHYTREAEQSSEFPEGVFAEFFDRDGNVESSLSAKYAIHYTDKGLWEAREAVEVINREGEVLNTEQLFWDENQKIIYSNSFVKITRPNEIIMGEGFDADETFTRWKIKKIQGTIYIGDESP